MKTPLVSDIEFHPILKADQALQVWAILNESEALTPREQRLYDAITDSWLFQFEVPRDEPMSLPNQVIDAASLSENKDSANTADNVSPNIMATLNECLKVLRENREDIELLTARIADFESK
jgi:hypothetical protein